MLHPSCFANGINVHCQIVHSIRLVCWSASTAAVSFDASRDRNTGSQRETTGPNHYPWHSEYVSQVEPASIADRGSLMQHRPAHIGPLAQQPTNGLLCDWAVTVVHILKGIDCLPLGIHEGF